MPGNTQNLNRYTYCFNNPLIYTDPTGEYAIIDDAIAAAVGGVINLTTNIIQGNIEGDIWECIGQGAAAFGAGAVGGWGALYPQFGGWVWGGATVGGTNAWLGGATTGEEILIGAGVGGLAGLAGGAAGQWGGQYIGSVITNGTQITSPVLQGAITGAAGGAIGGYAGGFTGGYIATGDLKKANQAGLNGLWTGAAVGGVVGGGAGYKYAKDNNINPWTGKYIGKQKNQNINQVDLEFSGKQKNHNKSSYIKGKSHLEMDAQVLLDDLNSGKFKIIGTEARNSHTIVEFYYKNIGTVEYLNGYQMPTNRAVIHLNSQGKIHIVPHQ